MKRTYFIDNGLPCHECGETASYGLWENDEWICLDCGDRQLSEFGKEVLREIARKPRCNA